MKPRVPHSYDEITRDTVLDPDGSRRVPAARESTPEADQALRATVADALLAQGITEVGLEVENGQIILRGWIHDSEAAGRVVHLVTAAAPDAEVIDRMHVGRPA